MWSREQVPLNTLLKSSDPAPETIFGLDLE
jgi:hypothetical protein